MTTVFWTCNREKTCLLCLKKKKTKPALLYWPCLIKVLTVTLVSLHWATTDRAPLCVPAFNRLHCFSRLLQYALRPWTWTFLGSTCTLLPSVCPRTLATRMHSGELLACVLRCLAWAVLECLWVNGGFMVLAPNCSVLKVKISVNFMLCSGFTKLPNWLGNYEVVLKTESFWWLSD